MGEIACTSCDKSSYFDACSNEGAIVFITIAIFCFEFALLLSVSYMKKFVKEPGFRALYSALIFHVFLILELISRALAMIGSVKPFCFPMFPYNALGSYPVIFQSVSISVIIYKFLETMEVFEYGNEKLFKRLKLGVILFIVIYAVLFSIFFTVTTLCKSNCGFMKSQMYIVVLLVGQVILFVVFFIFGFKLANKLLIIDSNISAKKVKITVFLVTLLLLLRFISSLLNIEKVIDTWRTNDVLYIYIASLTFLFEIVPAILTLILFKTQSTENEHIEQNRESIHEILHTEKMRNNSISMKPGKT